MSDVGKVVADIQGAYGIADSPLAGALSASSTVSAAGLLPLLDALATYTDAIEKADGERVGFIDPGKTTRPDADALTEEIARWRVRLDWYRAAAETPDGTFDDPSAVLWDVAAPLLTGHYYGPDGDELRPPDAVGMRGEQAWGMATPPVEGAAPDVRTPFMLMSQVDASASLRLPTFVDALREAAREAPSLVGQAVGDALAQAVKGVAAAAKAVGFRWYHGVAVAAGLLLAWRITR